MNNEQLGPVILTETEACRIRGLITSLVEQLGQDDDNLNALWDTLSDGLERGKAFSDIVRVFSPSMTAALTRYNQGGDD